MIHWNVRYLTTFAVLLLLALLTSACTDETDKLTTGSTSIEVSGAAQKGPLAKNSQVTIWLLDELGNPQSMIETQIHDELGNYSFSHTHDELVEIIADGFYRNEITGGMSNSHIKLRAVQQLSGTDMQLLNINVLTHLTSDRTLNLVVNHGMLPADATAQAETEFLDVFSRVIPHQSEQAFASLSLMNNLTSSGSSYLLSLSSLLCRYADILSATNASNPDVELQQLIDQLAADFGANGRIDDAVLLTELRETIPLINPAQVTANLVSWIGVNPEYVPVDINEFLDSDLDGLFNIEDPDDDNDGLADSQDNNPYSTDIITSDQQISTHENVAVNIDISSDNLQQDGITYNITTQANHGVIEGQYPTLTYTPGTDFSGIDHFTYVLSWSSVRSDETRAEITVLPLNEAPVITGTPTTRTTIGRAYSFTPVVINTDNDILAFSIENQPAWTDFDTATGKLSGTPVASDKGRHDNIVISVSDGRFTSSLDPFWIEVIDKPWSDATPIPTARYGLATATDGLNIYASGGADSNYNELSTLEIYNIATDTWASASPMQNARQNHTSLIIDKVLYVIGGSNGARLASVEAYDITTGIWSDRAPMNTERTAHASCVYNGNIYVFGGYTDKPGWPAYVSSVEMYDPISNTWTSKSPMRKANWGMACTVLDDQILLLAGDNNPSGLEVYKPSTDTWIRSGSLNSSHGYDPAAAVINHEVYLVGGTKCLSGCEAIGTVEAIDPVIGIWATKTYRPRNYINSSSVATDGRIFTIGGFVDAFGITIAKPDVQIYESSLD